MARRKKLSAVEALEGNPGKRVIEESGIEALGEPFVAEHLMDDARGCIEVIKQSMPSSVYSALDSFHLAAFGMAWAIHKKASLEISNPAFAWIVTNSAGSETQSPWIKMLNGQAAGGSFYRAMSSESGTKHGLNPTFVVFDELAQAKNRDLYDVLDASFGARAEPLLTSLNTSAYLVFTGVELISIYRALAMRDHHGRNV
jgi:hypothetical protein